MKQQHHNNSNALSVKRNSRLITYNGLRFSQHGFTLIELLIAVTIAIIIIGATYATYISQQRSFTAQDQVAEMASTSKVALDLIANDIREAGFGVPDDLSSVSRIAGCMGINGYTDAINLADGAGPGTSDSITLVGGFRFVGNIATAVSSGSTTLDLTDVGNINITNRSYISISGLSFAIVTGVSGNTLNLQSGLDRSYPAGVPVFLVENRTYSLVPAGFQRNSNGGCLIAGDTDTIAENIEDFQIAFGVDTNGDGIPDLFRYDENDIALGAGEVRLSVRVNLLAQTARDDPNFRGQGNPPTPIENRTLPATNDSLRRRWWRMQVDPRNPI